MAYFQPISFLPQDTVTPAIQNLGATLGNINQSKIAQQEQNIAQFNNLLDISYEGALLANQKEITDDLDNFRKKAADIYSRAAKTGGRPNFEEFTKLKTDQKNITYKVNQSQFLQEQYKKAAAEMTKLKTAKKLDPSSEKLLDEWVKTPKKIAETVDPMSFVKVLYTPEEALLDLDKVMNVPVANAVKKTTLERDPKSGQYYNVVNYDPTSDLSTALAGSPRIMEALVNNYGSPAAVMNLLKSRYDVSGKTLAGGNVYNYGGGGNSTPKPKYNLTQKDGYNYVQFAENTIPTAQYGNIQVLGMENTPSGVMVVAKAPHKYTEADRTAAVKRGASKDEIRKIDELMGNTVMEDKKIPYSDIKAELEKSHGDFDKGSETYNLERAFNHVNGSKYAPPAAAPPEPEKPNAIQAAKNIWNKITGDKETSKPAKLSGKINPSDLQVGKLYDVNGQTLKWNGSKLVKP